MSEKEKLSVLVVEPDKMPYRKEIDAGLTSLQKEVGGYIEIVYPFSDAVGLVGDEEAKLKGKPLNRSLRDMDGDIYDIMAGTFLVVGLRDEDLCSLSEELSEKYMEHFKYPEDFYKIGGQIISIPYIAEIKETLDEKIKAAEKEKTDPMQDKVIDKEPER